MVLVVSNQGEDIALKALLNHTPGQNLVLRLFKSNTTPGELSVEGDFIQADFTGYASLTLVGANWVVVPGAPTQAAYAEQTFASTANQAAQSIYGYYLTQVTSGKYVYGERFTNGPYVMANNGDLIKVTAQITAD